MDSQVDLFEGKSVLAMVKLTTSLLRTEAVLLPEILRWMWAI